MAKLQKKPSLMCSAFLTVLIVWPFAHSAEAAIQCDGNNFFDSVTRAEVSGIEGAGADNTYDSFGTQTGSLVNQQIDLNITIDINAISAGQVTAESVDWVWQLTAENRDKLTGNIVADYQFNSVGGPGKICSTASSCMDILNVQSNIDYNRRPNGRITLAEGYVVLTLDLANVTQSGNYQADLTLSLHQNNISNPSLCP